MSKKINSALISVFSKDGLDELDELDDQDHLDDLLMNIQGEHSR